MEVNTASWDRAIRGIIGVVALILAVVPFVDSKYVFLISDIVQLLIFGIIGVIMLFTAATGFCPLYKLFGISTCPTSSET